MMMNIVLNQRNKVIDFGMDPIPLKPHDLASHIVWRNDLYPGRNPGLRKLGKPGT